MPMTPRENLLSLYRREGYTSAPVGFHLCPSLEQEFARRHPDAADYMQQFEMPHRIIYDPGFAWNFDAKWRVPGSDKIDWHAFYPEGYRETYVPLQKQSASSSRAFLQNQHPSHRETRR